MRKILLCALGFMIGFSGFTQNKPVLKLEMPSFSAIKSDRIGQEPVKTKPITTSMVNTPLTYKNTGDVSFVTCISIGTAANAYSYGYAGGQKSILYANNDINTVSHFHRQGGALDPGGYSGDLSYDVSFDGGMSWTNQVECYVATNNSGGTYYTDAGRYPNHGIWNPPGNTDPANAYLTYYAACLDGSNGADSWGGHAFGRARFGDIGDTTKNLTHSSPPFYQYLPDAYDVSKDGVIIAVDANQDWTTGTVAYQGSLIVYRGVWDEGVGDFIFERSLLDFPTNAENDRPVHVKFAFGPDGKTGWIAVVTDNASITPLYDLRYYYPVLIKTTDAGLSWEDPIPVRLDGPDGLYGVLNYLTDEQIAALYEPPLPAREEIPYTTAFDCDLAVDTWGNPHMAVVVGVGASSEYSIISASDYFAAFDIFSTDGGTSWDGYCCGKAKQFRGTFGTDYTEDNRIQISSTMDGGMMFVTWLDTQLDGATENNAPDIMCRGIDVNMPPTPWRYSTDPTGDDLPTNVTSFSEAMWQSYFAVASRYVFDDGDGMWTVPFSYEALTTPFDPTLPVQYKYVQDFSFVESDFELLIGVDEKENIISSAQNYPNPFSQSTTIRTDLVKSANLSLRITDITGREIMQINKGIVNAGTYEFTVNGANLQDGVYFYTIIADNSKLTRKMVVK
jgi:hypothetical protein